MLAVMWPFGSPARFADSGGTQTRCAQTLRAFSPVPTALLGHTTRPGKRDEKMILLIYGIPTPTLGQGLPSEKNVHPESRAEGVRLPEDAKEEASHLSLSMY